MRDDILGNPSILIIFRNRHPTDLTVKYGTTVWNDTSVEWHEVEKLIPHEKYRATAGLSTPYDIGLIRLKKEILYNNNVKRVKLPTSDNIADKFPAVFLGWGLLNVSDDKLHLDGPQPKDLQQVTLNVVPYSDCVRMIKSNRRLICAFSQKGKGTCRVSLRCIA